MIIIDFIGDAKGSRVVEPLMFQVFFYIDPDYCDDPAMDGVNNITLSYTFFKTDEDDDFDEDFDEFLFLVEFYVFPLNASLQIILFVQDKLHLLHASNHN